MNSAAPRTSPDRDRAVRRLSRLTIGTAIAGTLGSVAFGGLAALTYRGSSTVATTAAQVTTSSVAASPSPGAAAYSGSGLQAATPYPTTTTTTTPRSAHVSTGGS